MYIRCDLYTPNVRVSTPVRLFKSVSAERPGIAHLELAVDIVNFNTFNLLESIAHAVDPCIEFKVFWRLLDNLRPGHSR